MTDASEIYAFIASRGQSCRLPKPWHAFSADEACFFPRSDHADQFVEMQQRFNAEALVKAGITVLDAQGRTVLNPALSDPDSMMLATRKSAEAPPFALVSDKELASETINSWAFVAVLGDHRAKLLLEKFERQLFIVDSMADVAVLWAMGFPAAPSA